MRTLEECRQILRLSRKDFAESLGIERSTYYNWMHRPPSKTALILANLLADAPKPVETKIKVINVDVQTLARDMPRVHELRSLSTPVTWKEIAGMTGVSTDLIQRRYSKWKAEQSSLSRVSQLPMSKHSKTAITQKHCSTSPSPSWRAN